MVGKVPGATNPDNPDMSVMVGAVTTRAQARQEAVRKPLRVPDALKHTGVDQAELIRLQLEDYTIKTDGGSYDDESSCGKAVIIEMKKVYRVYHDMARVGATTRQVVLPESFEEVCDVDCSRYNYWWPPWN